MSEAMTAEESAADDYIRMLRKVANGEDIQPEEAVDFVCLTFSNILSNSAEEYPEGTVGYEVHRLAREAQS